MAVLVSLVAVAQLLILGPTPVHAEAADPPPLPAPFQVEMTATGFEPATIEVVVGQSVVFTNHSGATRKVQATSGMFDSGNIPVGGAFTVAIPDERTVPFVSNGSPNFVGSLQVGPNGFTGPAGGLVQDHLPTTTAPPEDPASFGVEPVWGLTISRTTLLLAFAGTTTVQEANALLGQIHGRVSGVVGDTRILVVTIDDPGVGSYDDIKAAVDALQADPKVRAATLDVIGGEPTTHPVAPAPNASGFSFAPYPYAPNTSPVGAFGVLQARFPQAWNLFDGIKRKGGKVDIGEVDTGFDLTHPEFGSVPGLSKHVDFVPTCSGLICSTNPTGSGDPKDPRGHGTGTLAQLGGVNVGADPLDHLVVTNGVVTTSTDGEGGSTVVQKFASVSSILAQKKAGGLAPNLRVMNLSVGWTAFGKKDGVQIWDTTFKGKSCGPGDGDDGKAGANEPCTPNNEDGFRKLMANLGKMALDVAKQAATQDVLLVESAHNFSGAGGNYTWCVPLLAAGCTPAQIRGDAVQAFSWAARHLPADQVNNILVVGAVDAYRARSPYSNVNVDIAAGGSGPSGGTTSAAPRGPLASGAYTSAFGGTSGAAPYVSALAALISDFAPQYSASEVRALIIAHADRTTTGFEVGPLIDAHATLSGLPGGLLALADINDLSPDGNRRVIHAAHGSNQPSSVDTTLGATVNGQQLMTAPDDAIDMRDFRRYRDAWLQGCQTSATAGCPVNSPAVITFDGAPDNPKRDLNQDGCVETGNVCDTPETLYPRMDPAGTGGLSLQATGKVGVDANGIPTDHNRSMTNLDVYKVLWGKTTGSGKADTEGWSGDDLSTLLTSADIEVHPDSLFDAGATSVDIAAQSTDDGGKHWVPLGKPRTVTKAQLREGVAMLTVPVAATEAGTKVRVSTSAEIGGKLVTTARPGGTLHPGEDMRVDPKIVKAKLVLSPKVPVKGKKAKATMRLTVDGLFLGTTPGRPISKAAGKAAATADEPSDYFDGTEDLIGAPVTFEADGVGTDGADPSVESADTETDDTGSASATIDSGDKLGDAEITAEANVDGDPVTVVLPTTISGPTRLVYTWEQTITDWSRHFHGLAAPDPDAPGAAGTYDYDETPKGAAPVVLTRTGSVDLDAATPTVSETVGDGTYSIHTVSPFGQGDETSKILAPQNQTTDYPLDRAQVDKADDATTISGLRQISDINYRYDCAQVNPSNCGSFSRLHFFDSWLTITPRRDVSVYQNGQLVGTRGGDGTSFLHAPDPDADVRIRKDSSGNWIPISFCGSGAFTFPDDQRPLYAITGGGHQETRFTATIVNGDHEETVDLPDCSNPAPPQARFSSDADPGRIGTPVTFSDESVAVSGVQAWLWDFGDKRTSTDPNPDHVYDSPGEYTVKLTITDGKGRTSSVTHVITVNSNPPTANIDDLTASASEHVVLHGQIGSPSEFDRRSLRVEVSSSAIGFPAQISRRLPAGPIDIDLGTLPVGTYPVTMTVTDLQGQTVTATATIVVIAGTPDPPAEPGPVTLPPVDGCTTGVTVDGVVDELITGIDDVRVGAHRLEVIASPALQAAALRHATDLSTHPDLVDVGSDGSTLADRVGDAGYFEDAEVDELVLRGQRSAADALATWQTSTASSEKLVDRRWTAVGAARVASGSSWVWVVVLGDSIDCAADDGGGSGVRAEPVAAATSLPERPAPKAVPATEVAPAPAQLTVPPTRTTERSNGAAPRSPKPARTSGNATRSASLGATPTVADYPDAPVPAFTIDNVAPTTGTSVAVHNRTRRSSLSQRGRFLTGDERTDARTIASDSTLTTAWYTAGSPSPSITSDELLNGQTKVTATLGLHVAGSTVTPAVAYTGPTTAAQGATIRATATVTNAGTGQQLAGRPVTFTLGAATASGSSDDTGKVVAQLTISDTQPLGNATLTTKAEAVGASPATSTTSTVSVFANVGPVADAGGPYELLIGGDLILDGSGSSDPDATSPISFGWDIGDRGAFDFDHDMKPHVLWSDEIEQAVCGGPCQPDVPYPLALEITDQYGATDIDRTTITFRRDFNLTINPPSTILNPGAAVSYRVGVLTDNGFTDTVHLAVGSLPDGLTASFDNADVKPGGSAVLTIRASQTIATGNVAVDVTGTAAGITRHVGGTLDLEFGLIPVCYSSIEGKVTDQETGAGIGAVRVGVAPVGQGIILGGDTKADGTFFFDKLPVGSANNPIAADVSFQKNGYEFKSGFRVTLACNLTAHQDADLLAMQFASVTGRITEGTRDMTDPQSPVVSTGVPVAGATVATSGGSPTGPTGADGGYRVDHISLGVHNAPISLYVQADVDGYWRGSVRDVPVSAAGPNVGDVTVLKACYGDAYVKVVDDATGAPIPGVTISYAPIGLAPNGWRADAIVTPTDGVVHLVKVPLGQDNRPGTGAVRVDIPFGSPYLTPTSTIPLSLTSCGSTGLAIVRLKQPPPVYSGGARVQVVDDETGAPIQGISVNGDGTALVTDAQGYVRFDHISFNVPGNTSSLKSFSTNPSVYYSETIDLLIKRDEVTEGTIRLHKIKTTTIEGTVTDSFTGAPISNVQVSGAGSFTYTDDAGHYLLSDVQLTRYNAPSDFGISSPGNAEYWGLEYAVTAHATLAGPNVTDFTLIRRCSPATIHGVVFNAVTHEPLPDASVIATGGRPVATDANGRFELTNLAYAYNRPGSVDITASKEGFLRATKRVTVFCGADIEVNFGETTPTTTITGTVTNKQTGAPVSGAFVGSGFGGTATTNASGGYTLVDVPLGAGGASRSWTVTASPPTGVKLLTATKTGLVTSAGPNVFDIQLDVPTISPIAAKDDEYDVAALGDTTVAAGDGVLANDTGQGLSASVITAPVHGTLILAANGSFTYQPPGNRVGDETFTYKATDATGQTRTATVILHVDAPEPPVAHDDAITMPQAGSYFQNDATKGLLANDEGDATIRVISNSQPSNGQFSYFADGRFIVNPFYAYYGTYTIDYTIADRFDRRSTATLTVTVVPTTDTGPPVVTDDTGATPFATPLTKAAPGVLGNDMGMALTVTDNTSPFHGDVTMAANGSYTYTPDVGFSGEDSWAYTVTDALGRTARGTVRITVGPKPAVKVLAIGDRVWTDADADGLQDPGEPGVGGVAVQLLDGQGALVAATTTAADGAYAFDDLVAGDYGLRFTAPIGTQFTTASAGSDPEADSNPDASGLVATFRLAEGDDPRLHPSTGTDPVKKADLVDRSIDAGLVALPAGLAITTTARPVGSTGPFTAVAQAPWGSAFEVHVVVVNTGQASLSGVAVTDPDGIGCARTIGTLASGATSSYDCTGSTTPTHDGIARVHVGGATPSEDQIEADDLVSFQLTYAIGDRVWDDRDHDGIQDDGEPGLGGVAATLLDGDGDAVGSTTSGSDGTYRFDGVRPGSYRVRFARTGAYRWTASGVGSDRTVDSDAIASSPTAASAQTALVTIADGQAPAEAANPLGLAVAALDAGLWRPSSLAGTAYADADHDGTRDAGEAAIPGIAVELLDADGKVVATTKTSASGGYLFDDLVPGTYRVRWTVPAGYSQPAAARAATVTATSDAIRVGVAQAVTGVDIALWPVAVPTTTTTTTTSPPSTTTTTTAPSTSSSTSTTGTTDPSTTTTTGAVVRPAGTTPPPADDGTLPRTGQDVGPLVLWGALLSLAGGMLVLTTRRRRLLRRP